MTLPKPYYQDDSCVIYNADCRDILPHIGPVDCVICDPPYGIGFGEYESHKDSPAEYTKLIEDSIFVAEGLVKNGWVCIFQAAKKCREWATLFPREWRLLACAKNFVQLFKGEGPTWATDYALLWKRGEVTQRGKGRDWHLAITSNMSTRPQGHPCPRPIDQMLAIVDELTEEKQTILDPFMGSGSTLLAAKQLGRKAIGIEIEEKYCAIAVKRLSQEVLPLVPKQPAKQAEQLEI